MRKNILNALALSALLAPAAMAMDSDQNVLAQVPEPVRQSLLREAMDGGRVAQVEQDVKDNQQYYKARIETVDGKWNVKVSPDGTIFDSDRKEVDWNKAPAAVQTALLSAARGGKILRIDRKVDAGQNTFAAIIEREGKLDKIWLSEQGAQLKQDRSEMEKEVKEGMSRLDQDAKHGDQQLQQLPDSARSTVQRELGSDGKVKDVRREEVNGRTVYNISIDHDGKTKNLRVTEDGQVVQ